MIIFSFGAHDDLKYDNNDCFDAHVDDNWNQLKKSDKKEGVFFTDSDKAVVKHLKLEPKCHFGCNQYKSRVLKLGG